MPILSPIRRHTLRRAAVVLAALIPFLLSLPRASAQCRPDFPLEAGKPMGWQGGDAAYSIPLPDGRDVWIFGDTLYGPKRVVEGHDPQQVHNSLGISTCTHGQWHIDYVIQRDASGKAVSYFSPTDTKHWYWALDGFYANGDLWVTLLCIRHAAKPQPWAMDFETCGSDLAHISHLERKPRDWEVNILPLVADGVGAYPSATTVVDGKYAYLFALYEHHDRPLLATRIPLNGLTAPAENLEYLAADGTWKRGFEPAKAKEVMKLGSTELSIRYHPAQHEWRAVLFQPGMFSSKMITRTAPALTGPWTDGDVLYTVPEMQPGPARDKSVFCYAGKEHPEFETKKNEIVATYVCNTMDVPGLVKNLSIYHPKVVTRSIPEPR
jgi:hypothetical protein